MFKKRSFCFIKILKNRTGFTMIEVAVTLSILGILTAIAVPSYLSWLPRHKLQTSVRQIYDDMNLAKIRAVKDNKTACITFNTGNESYTVYLEENSTIGYTAGVDTLIKGNVTLENGVDITGTPGLTSNTCGFNNRGLLPAGYSAGQINLTNPTGGKNVIVNAAGGIRIL